MSGVHECHLWPDGEQEGRQGQPTLLGVVPHKAHVVSDAVKQALPGDNVMQHHRWFHDCRPLAIVAQYVDTMSMYDHQAAVVILLGRECTDNAFSTTKGDAGQCTHNPLCA